MMHNTCRFINRTKAPRTNALRTKHPETETEVLNVDNYRHKIIKDESEDKREDMDAVFTTYYTPAGKQIHFIETHQSSHALTAPHDINYATRCHTNYIYQLILIELQNEVKPRNQSNVKKRLRNRTSFKDVYGPFSKGHAYEYLSYLTTSHVANSHSYTSLLAYILESIHATPTMNVHAFRTFENIILYYGQSDVRVLEMWKSFDCMQKEPLTYEFLLSNHQSIFINESKQTKDATEDVNNEDEKSNDEILSDNESPDEMTHSKRTVKNKVKTKPSLHNAFNFPHVELAKQEIAEAIEEMKRADSAFVLPVKFNSQYLDTSIITLYNADIIKFYKAHSLHVRSFKKHPKLMFVCPLPANKPHEFESSITGEAIIKYKSESGKTNISHIPIYRNTYKCDSLGGYYVRHFMKYSSSYLDLSACIILIHIFEGYPIEIIDNVQLPEIQSYQQMLMGYNQMKQSIQGMLPEGNSEKENAALIDELKSTFYDLESFAQLPRDTCLKQLVINYDILVNALSNAFTNTICTDVDTISHEVCATYNEIVITAIFNSFDVKPQSKEYARLESFIQTLNDEMLTKQWLNYNYYESDDKDDAVSLLSLESSYFDRLA